MEYWKANDEVHKKVLDLIGQNHPDLAIVSHEIVVVFREKAGKSGGTVILGTPKKATALANALASEDYKFILEIGADTWKDDLTSQTQEALLDHLLTACRCEEDEKTGENKCSVAKPDIVAFRENIERYGMWFPRPDEGEGEDPAENAIKEMFGA